MNQHSVFFPVPFLSSDLKGKLIEEGETREARWPLLLLLGLHWTVGLPKVNPFTYPELRVGIHVCFSGLKAATQIPNMTKVPTPIVSPHALAFWSTPGTGFTLLSPNIRVLFSQIQADVSDEPTEPGMAA